jgi:hypothetical protein
MKHINTVFGQNAEFFNVKAYGKHIVYWWEIQKEGDHWEDNGVGDWTVLK